MHNCVPRRLTLIPYDCTLMIEDLPAIIGLSPQGRSTGDAIGLHQRIGEEVMIVANRSAMAVFGLPSVFGWGVDALVLRVFVAFDHCGQDFFPTVAATGCPDFPKAGIGHLLKILARGAEFRMMENRFALDEFVENVQVFRVGHGCDGSIGVFTPILYHIRSCCRPVADRLGMYSNSKFKMFNIRAWRLKPQLYRQSPPSWTQSTL
jgi:hypothetical protein